MYKTEEERQEFKDEEMERAYVASQREDSGPRGRGRESRWGQDRGDRESGRSDARGEGSRSERSRGPRWGDKDYSDDAQSESGACICLCLCFCADLSRECASLLELCS